MELLVREGSPSDGDHWMGETLTWVCSEDSVEVHDRGSNCCIECNWSSYNGGTVNGLWIIRVKEC